MTLRIVVLALLVGATWVCYDAGWRGGSVRPPVIKSMRRHFWLGIVCIVIFLLYWAHEIDPSAFR